MAKLSEARVHTASAHASSRVTWGRILVSGILLLLVAGYLANALWNAFHLSHYDVESVLSAVTMPFPYMGSAVPLWAEPVSAIGFLALVALAAVAMRAAGEAGGRMVAPSEKDDRDDAGPVADKPDEQEVASAHVVSNPPTESPATLPTGAALEAGDSKARDVADQSPYADPQPGNVAQTPNTSTPAAPGPFVPRVFISHTSTDNEFGYWLADQLKAAGIDIWYDSLGTLTDDGGVLGWKDGLFAAESWPAQIVAALSERNVFLVILSEKSVASRWVQQEIELAFLDKNSADPTRGKVIVPVLRETCNIPRLLATIQWVDFLPERDQEKAFAKVLYAVRLGRSIPTPSVTIGPPFDLALLPPLDRFVGREDDLERVLERIAGSSDDDADTGEGQIATSGQLAAVAATNGMPGIGKTALATEVVRRLMDRKAFPDGIAVVICKEKRDPIKVLKLALSRFTEGRREPEVDALPALGDFARSLFAGKHALVVLDNVENDLAISDVAQPLRAAGVAVLVTSRAVLPALPRESTVRLDVLPLAETLDLFALYYGRGKALDLTHDEVEGASRIVEALGRHTLAVKLAAANAVTLNRPLEAIARELEDSPRRALLLEDGEEAVRYVLESSLEALKEPARLVFALLAAFATSDIGRQAVLHVAGAFLDARDGRAEASLDGSLAIAETVLKDLIALRLVDAAVAETMPAEAGEMGDRERIRLHPLIQALAAERFASWDTSDQAITRGSVVGWYGVYVLSIPDDAYLTFTNDDENITAAVSWLHEHQADNPLDDILDGILIARICRDMSLFWYATGRTKTALTYLPWGIAAAERIVARGEIGGGRLRTAELTKFYGDFLLAAGQTAAAETAIERARTLFQAIEDRMGEATALQSLGEVMLRRGDLPRAELYFQQARTLFQAIDSPLAEASTLLYLSYVARLRNDPLAADEYRWQGFAHLQTNTDWVGDANALELLRVALQRNDVPAADLYFQQALSRFQASEDRQGERNALTALGNLARLRGDLADAEVYIQQALSIARKTQDTVGEMNDLSGLGVLAKERGDLVVAEDFYLQALAISEELDTPVILKLALVQLAALRYQRKKVDAALAMYERALTLDPHDSRVWLIKGKVLTDLGRYEEALEAYDSALGIDSSLADVFALKATILLNELNRYDDALAAIERSLEIEPKSITGWWFKGVVLHRLDRKAEAINAVAYSMKQALTVKPESISDWHFRSMALMALHRYEEALVATEQALAIEPDDKESQERRAQALRALGRSVGPDATDTLVDADTPNGPDEAAAD